MGIEPAVLSSDAGWTEGRRFDSNCPLVGPGTIGGVSSVGVFLRDPSPLFTRVSEKTTESFERLGRQAQPRFEPGTIRLPVLRAEPFRHWQGLDRFEIRETEFFLQHKLCLYYVCKKVLHISM